MEEYNIIGDVGGRFNELMKLVNKMPKGPGIILVGDLVDRGPDSRKVVEWAMNNDDVLTLKGNHESMMVEAFQNLIQYDSDHLRNGGRATLKSYCVEEPFLYPAEHIEWMDKLPLFIRGDGLFVSHAPWHRSWELGEVVSEHWALWHRDPPKRRDGIFQVYGHNHLMKKHDDYAICIDNTGRRTLAGMHWPSREIYEVPFE